MFFFKVEEGAIDLFIAEEVFNTVWLRLLNDLSFSIDSAPLRVTEPCLVVFFVGFVLPLFVAPARAVLLRNLL